MLDLSQHTTAPAERAIRRPPAWLTGAERDPRILGLVYFDYGLAQGKRYDWTLDHDPAAVTAWRRAAAGYPLAAPPRSCGSSGLGRRAPWPEC